MTFIFARCLCPLASLPAWINEFWVRGRSATIAAMSIRWYSVVVDCQDVAAQSRWWAEALDWRIAY